MARKIKKFYKVTPEILKEVESLASKGCYVKDIAVSIGWSKTTFYKVLDGLKKNKNKKRIKEAVALAGALKRGQSKRVVTLISGLAKRADGYAYTEQHIEDIVDKFTGKILTQKVKVITKSMPPDVAALIFSLVNLDGQNWSNKHDHKLSGDKDNPIVTIVRGDDAKL